MALRVRVMLKRLGVKDTEGIQQEIERSFSRVTVEDCVKVVCDLAQHQRSQDDSETKAGLAEQLKESNAGDHQ